MVQQWSGFWICARFQFHLPPLDAAKPSSFLRACAMIKFSIKFLYFTFLLHTSRSVDSFRTGPVQQSTRCPGLIQVKCYGQGLCVCVCASLSSCVLVYVTPGTGAQLTHDQRVLLPVSSTDTRLTGTDGNENKPKKKEEKKSLWLLSLPCFPSLLYLFSPSIPVISSSSVRRLVFVCGLR